MKRIQSGRLAQHLHRICITGRVKPERTIDRGGCQADDRNIGKRDQEFHDAVCAEEWQRKNRHRKSRENVHKVRFQKASGMSMTGCIAECRYMKLEKNG